MYQPEAHRAITVSLHIECQYQYHWYLDRQTPVQLCSFYPAPSGFCVLAQAWSTSTAKNSPSFQPAPAHMPHPTRQVLLLLMWVTRRLSQLCPKVDVISQPCPRRAFLSKACMLKDLEQLRNSFWNRKSCVFYAGIEQQACGIPLSRFCLSVVIAEKQSCP